MPSLILMVCRVFISVLVILLVFTVRSFSILPQGRSYCSPSTWLSVNISYHLRSLYLTPGLSLSVLISLVFGILRLGFSLIRVYASDLTVLGILVPLFLTICNNNGLQLSIVMEQRSILFLHFFLLLILLYLLSLLHMLGHCALLLLNYLATYPSILMCPLFWSRLLILLMLRIGWVLFLLVCSTPNQLCIGKLSSIQFFLWLGNPY